MCLNMADEIKEELETSTSPSEEEANEVQPDEVESDDSSEVGEEAKQEEPSVPLSRLREERQKRRELEKQLESKKPEPSQQEVPHYQPPAADKDEQKTVDEYVSNMARKTYSELKKAEEEELRRKSEQEVVDIEECIDLYTDFDEKAVKKVKDKYDLDSWDKAYRVWKDAKGNRPEPPKPKMPTGSKTTDDTVEEKENIFDSSLGGIVERAKEQVRKLSK